MRPLLIVIAGAFLVTGTASAQTASVRGHVVLRDDGQPLGYTTISLVNQGVQRLASDSGTFHLLDQPPGELRLRFQRIGFIPKDTALTLVAGQTASLRIEMTRLDIRLPTEIVRGSCTNETPFQPKPGVLAELFDQVQQNAERMILLASIKPFVMLTVSEEGLRDPAKPWTPTHVDTAPRGPLPLVEYEPKRVARRITAGRHRGAWGIYIPELSDFAAAAFTNTHCFFYAGQTRLSGDSVIAVDFEPIPSLAKEVDILGTLYLRADGYQLVGIDARLNHMGDKNSPVRLYRQTSRFREVVPGVPVLMSWELENVMKSGAPGVAVTGRVVDIRWADSTRVRIDTARESPDP